jgi:DNA-binding response OmpR family regulator
MNILIVEDETGLATEMTTFLKKENYLCELAHTGIEASEKISVNLYDFVLLDLGLPDYDGLDLIREARKLKLDTSFIIITARGSIEDKIIGLDLGADDYLAKPFSLHELHSRIQAVARRKFNILDNIIQADAFTINLNKRTVYMDNQLVDLTKREYDLLQYLLLNKNKVLTRIQLYEHLWGNILEDQYDSNFIDVHIKNLRKKLNSYGSSHWLHTVRGVGYRVTLD